MKNRKWQRILSWILTLTMLLGTFESNILAVNAMDDEVATAEADEDVEDPEDVGAVPVAGDPSGVSIKGYGNVTEGTVVVRGAYGASMSEARFEAAMAGNTTDNVTWHLFEEDTYKAATLPAGLTATIVGNNYKISGTPTEVVSNKAFRLNAVSSNGTASVNATIRFTVDGVNASNITKSADAATWANVKMGYTVDASAASSSTNAAPKTITLTNDTGVDLAGLTVKLTGTNKDDFVLDGAGTGISLAKSGTLSLTVAPKTGLYVENKSVTESKTFTAEISVSADCIDGTDLDPIPVTFQLKPSIEVAVTKDGAAYTKNDFGSVSAADAMPVFVYTATGADGLTWNESTLRDEHGKSILPEGVTGTLTGATLTIQGTPTLKAQQDEAYEFTPSVNDAKGNYYVLPKQTITVSYANVVYTVDGEKLGDDISKAVNKGYQQTEGQLKIVVTNNSAKEVSVNAALEQAENLFSIYGDAKKTIAAGASAEFVINPNTGWQADKSVKIKFTGTGLKATETTYTLKVTDGIIITKPVSDNTVIEATVGTAMTNYTFAAKGKKDNTTTKKWSVSADKPTAVEGYVSVSASELKNVYGIELSEAGVLSGTPASANQIAFTVSVNQGATTSSNTVLMKIASSNTAVVILDAEGNELKVGENNTNGTALALPAVGTNLKDVKGVSANVTIKNNSAVNIGDVTVTLDGKIAKFDTTANKYVATEIDADTYYEIVGSPISVTASSSKTFTIQPKVDNIYALGYAGAGSYRIKVKVNTNKNVAPKYFYALVEVKAAPVVYGYYKTNANDISTNTNFIEAAVNKDIVSVNMVAVSDNAANAKYPLKNIEWSWTGDTSATDLSAGEYNTVPEGLALSESGKITGTPVKAGNYYVSINVINKDTGISATEDYVIEVKPSGTIELKDNNNNEVTVISFNGAVKGAAAGDGSNVFVWATDDADVKNITISVKDASASYNGSAAHFTVDTTSIDTLAKGTNRKIVISPADTSKCGTYHAIVTVSSNEVFAQEIDVWFLVVDVFTVTPATATIDAEVGQPFSTSVNSIVIEYKNKDGVVVTQNTPITWREVSGKGAYLETYDSKEPNARIERVALNGTKKDANGFNYAELAAVYGPAKSGTYVVSVNGLIEEKTDDGLVIPSQSANSVLTINVAKSTSVNVTGTYKDKYCYATGTATSVNGIITSYTFAPKAVGYKDAGFETVDFKVFNASKARIHVYVKTTPSTNFIVRNDTDFDISPNYQKTYNVCPKKDLPVGTYTAQFIVSGNEIETQTVDLSFTVEPVNNSISVSDNEGVAISASGLDLDPVKKGTAAADITPAIVSVNNSGNTQVKIEEIREVKADGNNYAVGEPGQKLVINKSDAQGQTVNPTKYVEFTVAPVGAETAGVYESYVKVRYSVAGEEQTPEIFKVNYVVYKDSVSVNVTPAKTEGAADNTISLNSVSVNEGYSQSDATGFTKNITVTVGEAGVTGDATESIYGLEVSIDNAAQFVLGSADATVNEGKYQATMDVLAKGSSCGFTVAPKTGLPYGTYYTTLTITAENLKDKPITKTITFSVLGEKATTYTADKVTTEGVEEEYEINARRIWNTLAAVAEKEAEEDKPSVAITDLGEFAGFMIDANKDGREDITVSFDFDYTKATIKKVNDSGLTADVVSVNRGTAKTSVETIKPNAATGVSFNTIYFNLENIVSFNAAGGKFVENGKDVISINVANGKTITADKMPAVSMNNAALKTWQVGSSEFTTATVVSSNLTVTALWAPHKYPASASGNVAGQIEWTWVGDETTDYAGTYVTIYCTDSNCPDKTSSAIKLIATIEKTGKDATCTKGSSKVYTATAEYAKNMVYTDTKKIENDKGLGHIWKFDTASENVIWEGNDTDGYTRASINKTCQSLSHNHADDVDGPKTVAVSVNVTVSDNGAKCGEQGIVYYTATFDSTVDPAIKEAFSFQKVVEGKIVMHKWKAVSVESNGSFETAPTSASINIVCEKDPAHTDKIAATSITLVNATTEEKTYKYTGNASDGQEVVGEETFLSHKEHEWNVVFTWKTISTNKVDTVVTAEATCKNGGEKKALEVTLEDKTIGSKIQYTAKATDPNGKEWKEIKNIDTKTGESKDGPAGTPSVEGGDIVIIGLEETYPYTGSKIKPAVTVMDGDIVLAQSTDYTVSYTGKNKIGEINKVEVKGKGNYAGKSATAQFKIVDPRDEVDKDKLADKVSKVSVNTNKFTYNGKAQYPSEVTVTLKDKSTIVYKVEEDGSFTTESEKEVGLSFSNNINKGTATVAAIGSDGKVKKASYTIAPAEIGSAEFEISAADWAVKAATPEIKATIKLGDEDVELVAGQDYKVSFKAKEAGENKGTAKISGKGNFKGKHADVTYTVTPMEITENNIVVKAIAGKKAKDVKVTVNDAFGNALNKKFYTVEIQNAEGTALNKGDALTEEIKVVVKGANAAVTTGEDGVTVDVKPAADIAKVKGAFKVDKNFYKTYTGEPITLDADDFVSGKINVGTLELGKDFNIVAYKNNIKKGTMTVTVQGDGEYSGTKTFKVKIKAKPIDKLAPEN